jgi:predicted peptidase
MTACKLLTLALGSVLWLNFAQSRAGGRGAERGFLDRVFKDADGAEYKYVLFVPHDYKGDKPYPLVLFLHGAGECGTDGHKQVAVGLGPAIKKREQRFPFLVVFPQALKPAEGVKSTWHADAPDGKRALAILAEVQKEYRCDPKRVYLTGLSMGGFGTWDLAVHFPERWAALAPVCGGGDPGQAAKIKDIPCWCFHGDADPVVPVWLSREMIEALRQAGGHPKYTEYPKVGHDSWTRAYGTAELYDWLLMQHLK